MQSIMTLVDEDCFKVLCKGFSDSFEGFHSLSKMPSNFAEIVYHTVYHKISQTTIASLSDDGLICI